MAADPARSPAAVALRDVGVVRGGLALLDGICWQIGPAERWVVLGPNGSGKTTLLQVASARLWPTRGTVEILGERLGRVNVRSLRSRVALVSGAVTRQLPPGATAREVVVTGLDGALAAWWRRYAEQDVARAERLLSDAGIGGPAGVGDRPFAVISEGERQRVLLARALMGRPELVFFDEPAAGLDLGAREHLLRRLAEMAADPHVPPFAMVTHHVEEIPEGATHGLLLRQGRIVASGPLDEVMVADALSICFGLPLDVGRRGKRWWSASRS
jgi:iron complex transport system ATP-binding protein